MASGNLPKYAFSRECLGDMPSDALLSMPNYVDPHHCNRVAGYFMSNVYNCKLSTFLIKICSVSPSLSF